MVKQVIHLLPDGRRDIRSRGVAGRQFVVQIGIAGGKQQTGISRPQHGVVLRGIQIGAGINAPSRIRSHRHGLTGDLHHRIERGGAIGPIRIRINIAGQDVAGGPVKADEAVLAESLVQPPQPQRQGEEQPHRPTFKRLNFHGISCNKRVPHELPGNRVIYFQQLLIHHR